MIICVRLVNVISFLGPRFLTWCLGLWIEFRGTMNFIWKEFLPFLKFHLYLKFSIFVPHKIRQ